MTRRTNPGRVWLAPLFCLILLGGLQLEKLFLREARADATTYHRAVAEAAQDFPEQIGPWKQLRPIPMPQAAISLLKPNALRAYLYRHAETGAEARLMVAQCKAIGDIRGHYPPVCYPGNGWTAHESTLHPVQYGNEVIQAMAYRFTRDSQASFAEIIVYNVFVLPTGEILSGREGVGTAAGSRRFRDFGAAQAQVVVSGQMPPGERVQALEQLLNGSRALIEVIRSGARYAK